MRKPLRFRNPVPLAPISRALLGAVLLTALFASRADATLISDGTTSLRLDRGFLERLHEHGIRLAPTGRASGRESALEVPIRGGQLMAVGIGVVSLDGGMRFVAEGEKLAFKGLGLDTRHRTLGAARGKAGLNLARFRRLSSSREGFAIRIDASPLRLGGSFAALLDRKFGIGRVFRAGQPLGRVSVDATLQSVKALGGAIDLALDPGFAAKLATLGASVAPFESTSQLGPAQFSLPNVFGAVGKDLTAGTVYAPDGLRFFPGTQAGTSELDAVQVSVEFDRGLVSARFRLDLPTTTETGPLATVDFSKAQVTPSGEAFTVPPQPAQLSELAARLLNAALAGNPGATAHFAAGEPFARVGLSVDPG
jgi:hypothetical protein